MWDNGAGSRRKAKDMYNSRNEHKRKRERGRQEQKEGEPEGYVERDGGTAGRGPRCEERSPSLMGAQGDSEWTTRGVGQHKKPCSETPAKERAKQRQGEKP